MTLRRAVLYAGGASLLAAWFSSAASVSFQRQPAALTHPEPPADALAAGVEAQAKRLKARLAAAPLPQRPTRNPFAFVIRRVEPVEPVRPVRQAEPQPEMGPPLPPEPALLLIGLAEQKKPEGAVRTAMIETETNELILAVVGDVVLQRYKVTAIGDAAIELADQLTGRTRRLVLQ